jgi:MYXO-CTERM domain-containing protein
MAMIPSVIESALWCLFGTLLSAVTTAQAADTCIAWDDAGPLTDADVESPESSGVTASTTEVSTANALYYTLDDAGGPAALHMFDSSGAFRGEQVIVNATNTDWEDLASGPCPDALAGSLGERCLYIADIGDNDEVRPSITLWVVPETTDTLADAVACTLEYEDGPRNAETLLVSPADSAEAGTIRVVSKESDGEAKIYTIEALSCGESPDVLIREAELQLDGAATGGAMTATMTATTAVIRTLSSAWIWQDCEFSSQSWAREPVALDLGTDPQGEAIGVTADGGFITTSETSPFRFRLIPCAETGTPKCGSCGCSTAPQRPLPVVLLSILGVIGTAALRRRR